MTAVELVADHDLRAPARVVDWVLAISGDDAREPEAELLDGSGVLLEGELNLRLQEMRGAVAGSRVDLEIERGQRRGRGWLGTRGAVLVHPLPDGRARAVMVPIPTLVDALVRLNDVGPRPRVEPAIRIQAVPSELATALATRDAAQMPLGDAAQRTAFVALVGSLREHWRVGVHWDPAAGALSGREIEVLDTDLGYWLVVPDGPTVDLWPTTPTEVFRGLCRLFPLMTELS